MRELFQNEIKSVSGGRHHGHGHHHKTTTTTTTPVVTPIASVPSGTVAIATLPALVV